MPANGSQRSTARAQSGNSGSGINNPENSSTAVDAIITRPSATTVQIHAT
jgi:hypothetical protein